MPLDDGGVGDDAAPAARRGAPPEHHDTPRRRRRLYRFVARLLVLTLVVVAAFLALTPIGRYLARAAWEEGRILARRRRIDALVADGGVDSATRAKLALVLDARRFAVDSLGLTARRSFTLYTDLGRDTLVLVLSGARRDTLAPYSWWFPVVGRVPYKGFFDTRAARDAARDLRARGLDAYLRPSSAFSTLGWFDDPLLSTTLRLDSLDLANTVVHELTHNTFYAPGQAVFNESFASFVGARGAEWFFRARAQPQAAALVTAGWDDDRRLGAFWTALARALDSAYAAHRADSAARIVARDTVYARARRALVDSVAPTLATFPRGWGTRVALDNAALLARLTYARDLDLFDAVWLREGRDLRRAVARIVALARSRPADPYGALRAWLATSRRAP